MRDYLVENTMKEMFQNAEDAGETRTCVLLYRNDAKKRPAGSNRSGAVGAGEVGEARGAGEACEACEACDACGWQI